MSEQKLTLDSSEELKQADLNGDGHLSTQEMELMLEQIRLYLVRQDWQI